MLEVEGARAPGPHSWRRHWVGAYVTVYYWAWTLQELLRALSVTVCQSHSIKTASSAACMRLISEWMYPSVLSTCGYLYRVCSAGLVRWRGGAHGGVGVASSLSHPMPTHTNSHTHFHTRQCVNDCWLLYSMINQRIWTEPAAMYRACVVAK